jgi:hypothetical protein
MGTINLFSAMFRPFTHLQRLLLGAILSFIPGLNLFAVGYLLNCIKTRDMPAWRLKMFLDGLLVLLLVLIYSAPALFLFALVTLLEIPFDSFFIIPFFFLVGITAYLIPAATVNYAKTGKLFQGVFVTAFNSYYFIALILGLFWAAILNGLAFAIVRGLFYIMPLSLYLVVSLLVAAFFYYASQISFVTMVAESKQ